MRKNEDIHPESKTTLRGGAKIRGDGSPGRDAGLRGEGEAERAFREVIRAYGLINRAMHGHFARFGISGAKWGLLRCLHRAEGEGLAGLRMVDLGERLLVRPPSVTMLVGRLRRDGLVETSTSAQDRRAKVIGLTETGRGLVEKVLEGHGERIVALMEGLPPSEQRELRRLLGTLSSHLRGVLQAAAASPASGLTRRSGS